MQGELTRVHSNDFHWLAIDLSGRFERAEIPFLRITRQGVAPALFSFSDYPATFHTDGNLYLAPWFPGRIRLERMTPDPLDGRPRLRKLTADGRVTTLAIIEKAPRK